MVAADGLTDNATEPEAPAAGGQHTVPGAMVAVAFAVLLLVLAATSQGAYAVSRWSPLAMFTLAVLIGAVLARGGLVARSLAIRVALGGIWGLAAWSMLSMLWAQSSGAAWQGANRMVLYAAIATLPLALPLSRRALAAAGWAIAVGIGGIALYVLIRLLIHGAPLFLAGRLNGPVDYRNATALLFAMPFWPMVIAAATKGNARVVRAAALSLATLGLGLAFLTQSRGILIGLVVGGCLTLLLGPDRVRRAWVAALAIGGVALASHWLLRPFHAFDGGDGFVSGHDITVAAEALAVVTVLAFVVGMAIALFDSGLRADSREMQVARRAARIGLAAGVVVGIVGAAIAIGNPYTFAKHKWDEFRDLNPPAAKSTRLLTVGGQRYDLWRVALKEFSGAPLQGVGQDNYSFGYYRYRRSNRNLSDPHSLVFALISENGIVGVALFCLYIGGIGVAIRRGVRTADKDTRRNLTAPAALGAVLIGQSTVDWIWLIPGLTAIGLFALSAGAGLAAGSDAVAPAGEPAPVDQPVAPVDEPVAPHAESRPAEPRRRRPPWPRIAGFAGLLIALVSVLALFLSDAYIQRARTLIDHPKAELSAAQAAATLDPWSVTPHYLQASALETLGNRPAAYAQLRDALSLEPQNESTLGVLGDFEARGGDFAAARSYYRRALALDPLDTGLQQLARIGTAPPRRATAARRRRH